jgi:hypothetical protein
MQLAFMLFKLHANMYSKINVETLKQSLRLRAFNQTVLGSHISLVKFVKLTVRPPVVLYVLELVKKDLGLKAAIRKLKDNL